MFESAMPWINTLFQVGFVGMLFYVGYLRRGYVSFTEKAEEVMKFQAACAEELSQNGIKLMAAAAALEQELEDTKGALEIEEERAESFRKAVELQNKEIKMRGRRIALYQDEIRQKCKV